MAVAGLQERGYDYVFERDGKTVKCVGTGSFGRAMLVHNKHGQVFVAKELNLQQMSKKDRRSAENEVKLLQELDHPFIIKFVDSFIDDAGKMYIIMEYADGGDLSDKIKAQRAKRTYFSEDQVMLWFGQLCLALDHLHEKKILHRDLKTKNVFLTSSGIVKLGDFGFSKRLKTAAMAKTVCGTPYYFSPELCQGQPYSNKSDIWSLGVILYEIAVLQRPYEADSLQELMKKIVFGSYAPPLSNVPQRITRLIYSMLQKKDTLRPSVTKLLLNPYVHGFVTKLPQLLALKPVEERYPTMQAAANAQSAPSPMAPREQNIREKILAQQQARRQQEPRAAASPPPVAMQEPPKAEPQAAVAASQAVTEKEMENFKSQVANLPAPGPEVDDAAEEPAEQAEGEYSMIFEEYEEDFEEYDEGADEKDKADPEKQLRQALGDLFDKACDAVREVHAVHTEEEFDEDTRLRCVLLELIPAEKEEVIPLLIDFVIKDYASSLKVQ
eukprot:TRINITY_DN29121_c0_g1_i1.p1 TRINITY_DN29121_c0_g1~~TRINITY_DN29121_c0_g1_i1.p1  ORF type:complete len:497 (+),score=140.33 TRINITY_DN29121_c0_g1_i1:27-1517(+)